MRVGNKPQWGETGKSLEEMAKEATDIATQLIDSTQAMAEHEARFVIGVLERLEKYGDRTFISPKQLFWLRDLLEKYL